MLRASPSQSNNISHSVTMESVILEHFSFKTTILNAAPDLNNRTSQNKNEYVSCPNNNDMVQI